MIKTKIFLIDIQQVLSIFITLPLETDLLTDFSIHFGKEMSTFNIELPVCTFENSCVLLIFLRDHLGRELSAAFYYYSFSSFDKEHSAGVN